ncbi:MAG: hypothetical protein JW774_02610 [Candidatus Aureabacteria bacterium]|nr:hypothetical protein [Candidatus Auribacterota bacterium]
MIDTKECVQRKFIFEPSGSEVEWTYQWTGPNGMLYTFQLGSQLFRLCFIHCGRIIQTFEGDKPYYQVGIAIFDDDFNEVYRSEDAVFKPDITDQEFYDPSHWVRYVFIRA